MSHNRKRALELLALFLIVLFFIFFELHTLQLPFQAGAFQFALLIIPFVVVNFSTRDLILFCVFVGLFESLNVLDFPIIFIFSTLIAAFIVKASIHSFNLEARLQYSFLVVLYSLTLRSIMWIALLLSSQAPYLFSTILRSFVYALAMGAAAWLIYPLILLWMDIFDHKLESHREHEVLGNL